uniref:Uncharacterized protein n=1 Tax=Sinocyclocheilus grahami TaxID=75366 RepID=A0A672MKT0_SINGR
MEGCCLQGLGLSGAAEHLEYWLSDLGIPAPPVLKSEGLSMDVRLSRIVAGLELHRGLLQDLRQLSSSTEELSLLLADITDLSAQVLPSDSLTSVDQVQVAIHLSLQQLRSFTQDVLRSLKPNYKMYIT